jgi:3-oxoacyl-(acyl-carrier-protein) synthase
MSASVDVWVTAYGAVTGAGDEAEFRAAWMDGDSAIRPFEGDRDGLPPGYGATIPWTHKQLRSLPGGRSMRPGTMTASTFLAVAAVGQALANAGLDDPAADAPEVAERRGVYLGAYTNFPALKKHLKLVHTMSEAAAASDGSYRIDDSRIMDGMKGFTGFDFLKLMNNMPTAHGAIQAHGRGPANTFLGYSSVGLQAISRACDGLRLGLADQFVAGACGPGTMEGLALVHGAHGLLAEPGIEPKHASRPLDTAATGMVPGDGGAALVIETAESAAGRGASPIARVAACADLFVAPLGPRGPLADSSGIQRLVRSTLDAAGWAPSDVDYLSATGLGLPELDRLEAEAYGAVFGDHLSQLYLAVHTGVVGFCEAAHGPIGAVGALQAMQDGLLPPQVNMDQCWPGLEGLRRVTEPTAAEVNRALIVSLAPEGTFSALALERA